MVHYKLFIEIVIDKAFSVSFAFSLFSEEELEVFLEDIISSQDIRIIFDYFYKHYNALGTKREWTDIWKVVSLYSRPASEYEVYLEKLETYIDGEEIKVELQ